MKKPVKLYCLILVGLFVLAMSSCRKLANNSPVCRIHTLKETDTRGSTSNWTFTYDGNHLSSILDAGQYGLWPLYQYYYSPGMITIYYQDSFFVTRVYLGQSGRVDSVNDPNGATTQFLYDAKGTLSAAVSIPGNAIYEFTRGDLTRVTSGTKFVNTYQYYTDRRATDADLYAIYDYMHYGMHIFTNTHQVLSETYSGHVNNFDYEYDKDGRVIKATEYSDTRPTRINEYTYDCE